MDMTRSIQNKRRQPLLNASDHTIIYYTKALI